MNEKKQEFASGSSEMPLKIVQSRDYMEKPIWTTPVTVEMINHLIRNSLCDHLGIEFTEIGDNHLTAIMPVDRRTKQPWGILHGGASSALAETVGNAAAHFCIDQETKIAVGLDININHIRPVSTGTVMAVAKPIHLGKTTQVWEINIYNEQKKIVAVSRLTIAIIEKKRGENHSPQIH